MTSGSSAGSHSTMVSDVPRKEHFPLGASVTFSFLLNKEGSSSTERMTLVAEALKHLGYTSLKAFIVLGVRGVLYI